MKKWKQLVVFVMILTMVMGMTSFAGTPSTAATKSTSGNGSNSGNNETEKPEKPQPSLSSNATATPAETPKLTAPGDTAELVQKLNLTVKYTATEDLPTTQASGLVTTLKNLLGKGFGKASTEDKDGVSKAKLFVFDISVGKNADQIAGKTIQLELDCSESNIPDTANKHNLRLLHWTGSTWEMRPIISYTNHKLVAQFSGFSPFCLAYSAVPVEENYTNEVPQDKVTKPAEIVDTTGGEEKPEKPEKPGTTDPTPEKPGTTDPTPEKPDDNKRPTVTSDAWHLRFKPMAANKYNVLELEWDAYVGGKVEVLYSKTPEDKSSFKRLTTTKKTTYKFKKMEVGVEYGFQIRPKSDPNKASEILYVTREVSEIGTPVVTATAKSYNSVSVKWNKIPGVKRYAIYRTNWSTRECELAGVKSGTKFTDKRLTPGVVYTYQVAPIRVTGMKSDIPEADRIYSVATEESTAEPVLKSITGLKVTAVDSGTLKISWRKVRGATRYEVREAVTVNGVTTYVPVAGFDQPLNRTQVRVSSLAANSEHTYVVTAYGGEDSTSARKAGKTKIAK